MFNRVRILTEQQSPQPFMRSHVVRVQTEKVVVHRARRFPLPQAEVSPSENIEGLPAAGCEGKESLRLLDDGPPVRRLRCDRGLSAGDADSEAQALHVERFGAQPLGFSQSIKSLVGPAPIQVQSSEREMRQGRPWMKMGRLLIGGNGGRALERFGMTFGTSQELQIPTFSRTQNENEANEKKR
jgi:hypothetical protein